MAKADYVAAAALGERLVAWTDAIELITRWTAFAGHRHAEASGLVPLAVGVLDGPLGAPSIVPSFERAYYETVRRDLFARMPELKSFDGDL